MESGSPKEKERIKVYNKTTLENEKYTLTIKITKENSIYISIAFENNSIGYGKILFGGGQYIN